MSFIKQFLVVVVTSPIALAWQAVPAPNSSQAQRDVVVVTGAYQPLPLGEADRSVSVQQVLLQELVSNSFADFLRLDSSVDLKSRSPNGIQSDLSIRGSTFGQTLVLVDGVRMNDVQSGHHNLDLPIPLESIGQIEVLKGAGSTQYGSDAIGGVVNFITRRPEASEFRLRAGVGNFGVNQERSTASLVTSRFSQQLSVARDVSSGFRQNREYRNLSGSSTSHLASSLGNTRVTLGYTDRPFGADMFYGNGNSWERTRTWFASASQTLGDRTEASFAFRRHTDLFIFFRDRPEVSTNRHASESFQGSVRRHEDLAPNIRLSYGVQGFRDEVASNNLGQHDRARGAAYGALDVRSLKRFSFTVGARDEVYGSGDHEWSPSVSGGFWLSPAVKLRGSVSRAFRLPTFTDLYYRDPQNLGSPDLQPEQAWSYEGGIDWDAGGKVRASATVFQRRERNGIDYVRRLSTTDVWRATNFQSLRFTGFEGFLRFRPASMQDIELSYTTLTGAQDALAGYSSKYLFNYPKHNAVASWSGTIAGRVLARSRLGVLKRLNRDVYGVWDLYFARAGGRVRPFLQLTNLSSARYEEIAGVAMPGRGVVAGVEVAVWRRQ